MEDQRMKNSKRNLLVALWFFALLSIVSACSMAGPTQNSNATPVAANTIQGVVSTIVNNEVTIKLIKVKNASDRAQSQANEFTGESKTIIIADTVPIVTATRDANGVSENKISLSSIIQGDIIYVYYAQDGKIEKIRVIPK
jgi:hypothetical protein